MLITDSGLHSLVQVGVGQHIGAHLQDPPPPPLILTLLVGQELLLHGRRQVVQVHRRPVDKEARQQWRERVAEEEHGGNSEGDDANGCHHDSGVPFHGSIAATDVTC